MFTYADSSLLGGVYDAVAPTWMREAVIESVVHVTVTCCRAQGLERNHQAWARNLAGIDGIAKCNCIVTAANITRTGETLLEHLADEYLAVKRSIDVGVGYPILGGIHVAGKHRGNMHVAVDKSRQYRGAREVDDLGTWRCRKAIFDGGDLVVLDGYRDVVTGNRGDAVNQGACMDDSGRPGCNEEISSIRHTAVKNRGASIAAIISGHGAAFDIESPRGVAERGSHGSSATLECSLDLDRSTTSVEVGADHWRWQGASYPFLQACKDRTIYYWAGQEFAPVARYTNSLIKLVPTQWGAPTFEIDGIKMLPTAKVSPYEDAQRKVGLIRPRGKAILDTCGGLGYFAAWCLQGQAAKVLSYEKNPDVIWLRGLNPWSPAAAELESRASGPELR